MQHLPESECPEVTVLVGAQGPRLVATPVKQGERECEGALPEVAILGLSPAHLRTLARMSWTRGFLCRRRRSCRL
eukprot:scaffold1947_cov207-Prasinococcus_capsulatus_cf.AAC.17